MILRIGLFLSVSLVSFATVLGQGEAPTAKKPAVEKAAVENTSELVLKIAPAEQDNYIHITVTGDREVASLKCSVGDEEWQPMVEVEVVEGQAKTFRTKHPRFVQNDRPVRVRAFDSTLEKYVLLSTKLMVDQEDVSLAEVKTSLTKKPQLVAKRANVKAPSASRGVGGYRGEFLSLVNSYRAGRGLSSLTYSQSLESIAAINNQRGGYHRYTGGTAQVWAAGSATARGTLRQWQNSSGHNAILLGRNYGQIGIHYDGRGWTANLR